MSVKRGEQSRTKHNTPLKFQDFKRVVMGDSKQLVPVERIENIILFMRDEKVIIDSALAKLYGVTTKRLNEQVKRNKDRFPPDFMFQLTAEEKAEVVANCDHLVGLKFSKGLPFVFTEHGAVMAASVLNTPQAVLASILIMRTFIKLRRMFLSNADLRRELEEMKRQTNDRFQIVFETLDHLLAVEDRPKRKIGFKAKEKRAACFVIQNKKIAARGI